jgi:diguanylate cyclase (GGDEF)-like protein/PAS domain S-box-containing protein
MEWTGIVALINNAAQLLVLFVIYEVTYLLPPKYHRMRPVLSGLLISLICVVIMSMPFKLQPGLFYDTRSIIISVTALIFGAIPTIITVVVAILYRLMIGGVGTLPGIAVITSSALIGLAWRQWLYPKSMNWRWLSVYVMSITVHVTMLACMLLLPYPEGFKVIKEIAVPVMVIYPIASVILNLLLIRQQELRQIKDQLIQSEEKYRKITENVSDVIWTTDLNLNTTFVNSAVERLVGEPMQAHLKRPLEEKYPPDSLKKLRELLNDEVKQDSNRDKNRSLRIVLEHNRADGTPLWLAMNVSAIREESGQIIGFQGVSRDITELKRMQDELHYLLEHDDLTGLYNRRRFEKEIDRLNVESQLPLSIIIADINGLKLINDSFGPAEGDKIIVETANVITSCCREGDFLFRTGGDEFSLLLPKTDLQTARNLLKEIQIAVERFNLSAHIEANYINLSVGAETKVSMETDFKLVSKRAADFMNQRKLLEKNSSFSAILSSIKATMFEKSHETEEHSERMSRLSREIGLKLNLSQIELDHIVLLAKLHDIGKVGISEQILKKPGKLNEDEWVEMKKHPEIGYRIAMSSPNLAPIAEYILYHHERWDGRGYPQNLKGTDIPLISRIVGVVDAYDAMTEDRVYRKSITHEDAIEEIKRCAGTQFDPQIVEVFVEVLESRDYNHSRI